MNPSEELRARVLAAAKEEPAPSRSALLARDVLVGAIVLALALALFEIMGGFNLLEGDRPLPFVIGTAAGWAIVAGLCTWIAFGRHRSMVGPPRSWLLIAAVGAPIALAIWLMIWSQLYPETMATCPPQISPFGKRCRD